MKTPVKEPNDLTRASGEPASLSRRLAAEAGTALLLATVVGSGIMAERLSGGNVALALLANTLATGAGLVALILTFGGVSGAHFNPAVTIADAARGGRPWREVPPYVIAQVVGAFAGVAMANLMFDLPAFTASRHVRSGVGPLAGELTATFGLLSVICGCGRARPEATPFAVGAYITAAYWFTSSTSFANPASRWRARPPTASRGFVRRTSPVSWWRSFWGPRWPSCFLAG